MTSDLPAQLLAAALPPVEQEHLLEARQMQALSFAVHIPLVCFGIAFPSMVLLVESLYLRTGDELYRTLAKRWSKVMIALFAVGVVTGTILSFEMGLLWPNFMATFGDVFGLAFGLEGFSFFVEAIFIAIYVYGWDRMSPRLHLLSGVPVVVGGRDRLAVRHLGQRVDEQSRPGSGWRTGARSTSSRGTRCLETPTCGRELTHMYLAGFIVAGFLVAAAYAWGWLQGRRGRYERIALAVPLTVAALAAPVQVVVGDWIARARGRRPADQARGPRGARPRRRAARRSTCWAGTTTARCKLRDRDPEAAVAARRARSERRRSAASTRSRRTTGRL